MFWLLISVYAVLPRAVWCSVPEDDEATWTARRAAMLTCVAHCLDASENTANILALNQRSPTSCTYNTSHLIRERDDSPDYTDVINQLNESKVTKKLTKTKGKDASGSGTEFACSLTNCLKNDTYFKEDGSINALAIPGYTVLACGRKYFFGNNLVSVNEAHSLCCGLNMKLASLDSVYNLYCLMQYLRYEMPAAYRAKIVKNNEATFWTSGRRMNRKNIRWCMRNEEAALPDLGIPNKKAGSNNLLCAGIFFKADFVHDSYLKEVDCASKFLPLCEAEDSAAPSTPPPTTEIPSCVKPTCPKICPNCPENSVIKDIGMNNFTEIGACGKKLNFLSKFVVNFAQAQTACAMVNMHAAVYNQESELECILKVFYSKIFKSNKYQVWTSGTNQDCKKKFIWCSSDETLNRKADLFARSQPDNVRNYERCLSVGKVFPFQGVIDSVCDMLNNVVCQRNK